MTPSLRGAQTGAHRADMTFQPPCGSVHTCLPYRGELARHHVMTADGHHVVVATSEHVGRSGHYSTGVYPVQQGYLVMIRQPLYEVSSPDERAAAERHEQLVKVLAEAGLTVVKAQRTLAARRRAERQEVHARGVIHLPTSMLGSVPASSAPASI